LGNDFYPIIIRIIDNEKQKLFLIIEASPQFSAEKLQLYKVVPFSLICGLRIGKKFNPLG